MVVLDVSMCILETDMTASWKTQALPVAGLNTPEGAVTLAGQSRANRGISRTNMRVLGSFALVYVVNGQCEFGDDRGLRRTIGVGDAFLLFPDVAHFYDPGDGEPWDDIWLVFNGPPFEAWRSAGLLDPADPVWHVEPVSYWRQRVADVLTGATGAAASLVEATRLLTLLAEMRVARMTGGETKPEPWLDAACRQLETDEVIDWEQFSAAHGLTYEQFRKKFSTAMGVPPAQYRLVRRIDRAALRLRTDDAPLRIVAEELGFCDEFYFSKLFKRRTGLSPTVYRAQWRGVRASVNKKPAGESHGGR